MQKTPENIDQKITWILCSLIAFALPFTKIVVSVLIGALMINWLLIRRKVVQDIKAILQSKKEVLLFTGVYLVHALGLLYTINMDAGLFDMQVKLSLLLLPLALFPVGELPKAYRKKILLSFISGCLMALVICLGVAGYRYYLSFETGYFFYSKLSLFHHSAYFSMYLNMALAGCVYFFRERKGLFRYIYLLAGGLSIAGILMLSSRIGVITLAVVLLLYTLYFLRQKSGKKLVAGLGMLAVTIFLLIVFFKDTSTIRRFRDSISGNDQQINDIRLPVWKNGMKVWKEHFWIGTGTGDIKDELKKAYQEGAVTKAYAHALNAHNQFLQSFIALGVIGGVLFLISLLWPLWISWKARSLLYLFFLVIMMLNFLTESVLETQAGVTFYAFFNAFFYYSLKQESS